MRPSSQWPTLRVFTSRLDVFRVNHRLATFDETCAAFVRDSAFLLFERILDLLAGLFDVSLHLIDVPVGLELTVAGRLAGSYFELALRNLGHILGLVLF